MTNNPEQPREFDAVLGGETSEPTNSLVLGGIEGVKHRLKSSEPEVYIRGLSEALNYGKQGLDIVIEIFQRSPEKIQRLIARLLREKGGSEGKQFLLDYHPRLFFTALEDWNENELYSQYLIPKATNLSRTVDTKQQIKNLLEKPGLKKLAALVCEMTYEYEDSLDFRYCVNALVNAHQRLPNLKALFIGDVKNSEQYSDSGGYSDFNIGNINPIFTTFTNLEVLHLCGCLGLPYPQVSKQLLEQQPQEQERLQVRKRNRLSNIIEKQKHTHLKTLIIEGSDLTNKHISQLCKLEYPSLEYLELWLGRNDRENFVDSLAPILSGECCPNLLYLGLIGSRDTNTIAKAIARSKIISSLKVLDLKAGNLSSEGVTSLLNCPPVNNLYALNVSENCIEQKLIGKLSQLKCQVIADLQFHDRYNPTYE